MVTAGGENYKQHTLCWMHTLYSTQYTAYVIPSSVPVHLCVLCLFVLYPVPRATCHLQLRYHSLHQALTSLLFSGPNKDLTDKQSSIRVHDESFRAETYILFY
ncbi:hypothetical protein ATANTOWER_026291 [Ataeniobius toweri]|uniref:Uncharacterized protein n=1 Tax=Ataeniobius toweri TaxID=208326 RepID=A0ABU7AH23_9TELE|nr:hypothetical protein [Ataeniobius toweri]